MNKITLASALLAGALLFISTIPASAVTVSDVPAPDQVFYRPDAPKNVQDNCAVYDLLDIEPATGSISLTVKDLLVTSDLESASRRVEALKRIRGISLYAQAERNEGMGIIPSKLQLEFAQRYVYSGCYRRETWREYCDRKGFDDSGYR